MVGRHHIKASVSPNFVHDSADSMTEKRKTDIMQNLEMDPNQYQHGISLDLLFTNKQIYDSFRSSIGSKNSGIEIIRVLNSNKIRANRTILEVKLSGIDQKMAMKCVDCEITMADNETTVVESIAQKEVQMFDELPDTIRGLFVEKYAHGRIWFGSTSYEVILMESLYPIDVDQACLKQDFKAAKTAQLLWISQAFNMLKMIHDAGYSHGDAHLGNILWTKGIGQGDMKFINLERMINLNQRGMDNAGKAVRKLGDVGFLLFRNNLIYQGINKAIVTIDVESLHTRLKTIQEKTPNNILFLDDTLPYTQKYTGYGTWNLAYSKSQWKSANETQFRKISENEFEAKLNAFVKGMTDMSYTEKVFYYLISEINKTHEESMSVTVNIDDNDLRIPVNPHQIEDPQTNRQSVVYGYQNASGPTSSSTTSTSKTSTTNSTTTTSRSQMNEFVDHQISYGGQFIYTPFDVPNSIPKERVFWSVFRRNYNSGRVLIIASDGKSAVELDTSKAYQMFLLMTPSNRVEDSQLRFSYGLTNNSLMLYRDDTSNQGGLILAGTILDSGNATYGRLSIINTTSSTSALRSRYAFSRYA